MAKLEISEGNASREIELTDEHYLIGRKEDKVDIHLDHHQVSRLHAELVKTDKGYIISDLHSTLHTYVNHTEIKEKNLQHNDVISIRPFHLKYIDAGESNTFTEKKQEPVQAQEKKTNNVPQQGEPQKKYSADELKSKLMNLLLGEITFEQNDLDQFKNMDDNMIDLLKFNLKNYDSHSTVFNHIIKILALNQ